MPKFYVDITVLATLEIEAPDLTDADTILADMSWGEILTRYEVDLVKKGSIREGYDSIGSQFTRMMYEQNPLPIKTDVYWPDGLPEIGDDDE